MRVAATASALILSLAGAGCASSVASGSGKLRVVTAFYPVQFVAARVGGDLVEVSNLTPPGGEPHDLELRPSDVRALRQADVILYLADGFQPALEDAIKALPGRSRAIDLLAGLPLKAPVGKNEENVTVDPHVWLSPSLMARLVDRIRDALASKLPGRAAEFERKAAALKTDLGMLDIEYRAKLSHCALREFFTSHAAFAYLAERYGLRQVAITGLSPEAEPSPARLREVAGLARANHATTIFFETLVSPRVAQTVARIVGANTAVLDPIEGLTNSERTAGGDYFSVMRSNLDSLARGLECAA